MYTITSTPDPNELLYYCYYYYLQQLRQDRCHAEANLGFKFDGFRLSILTTESVTLLELWVRNLSICQISGIISDFSHISILRVEKTGSVEHIGYILHRPLLLREVLVLYPSVCKFELDDHCIYFVNFRSNLYIFYNLNQSQKLDKKYNPFGKSFRKC